LYQSVFYFLNFLIVYLLIFLFFGAVFQWSNGVLILQNYCHSKDSESVVYLVCNIFFSPANIIFWQLQIKILCITITRHDDYSVTDMPGNDANMIRLHKELENKQTEAGIKFELILENSSYFYSCNFSLIDVIQ
jgi:hypothetical protein